MQARYQYGNLTLRKRKKGPDVWQWRWCENGLQRATLIGTVEQYPSKSDAERATESLRIRVNLAKPQQPPTVTVAALADRFEQQYVPKRCRLATQKLYRSLLKNHILPKWGAELVPSVKTVTVEDWLESYPHSRQVKSHVRNLMHVLYQCALRWGMVERNPIDLVRQSRKRLKTPRVLTPAKFKALLGKLSEPYRTMAITVACLGLRVCELVGLQWGDIDFENLSVKIQRSVVEGEINPTKTEASESALPLDAALAETLQAHRATSAYVSEADFVFAGNSGRPRWPDTILSDHLKPAAEKAGIGKVGWYTFRHTYSTLLHALGTTPAVQKELLRHADIQTTLNIYTQAISSDKRDAASKLAQTLWLQ